MHVLLLHKAEGILIFWPQIGMLLQHNLNGLSTIKRIYADAVQA